MAAELNSCDVVDNWEDIDENKMFDQSLAVSEPVKTAYVRSPIVYQDDSAQSHYVPPEPSVKILKRPSREERLNSATTDPCGNGSAKPVKTLRQREAEYAEARLRILGRATSPEDQFCDRLNIAEPPPGPSAVYTLLRPAHDGARYPPEITRTPRGPNDSPGFALRR